MPSLDFISMAVLIALNLAITGCTLPLVMGTQVSRAAKHGQAYFLLQATGWLLVMLGTRLRGMAIEPWVVGLSTCCASAALWQMSLALEQWLGPRRLRYAVWALCLLGPLGFAIWHADMQLRLVWYCGLHGLTMLGIGSLCFQPQRHVGTAWRYLMAACALTMACTMLMRAYVAATTPDFHDFTQDNRLNHVFVLIAHLCGTMTLVSMLVAWRDEANQQLRELAMSDQLTGLANRHALLQAAPLMLSMAQRQQLPLSVMLLDMDHFKAVNDRHGHVTGDAALQLLGQVLRMGTRSGELAARWGGEEFCLLVYGAEKDVDIIYQRLRHLLHHQSQQQLGFALTISCGCAIQFPHAAFTGDFQDLLHAADTALYAAKTQGRDRLVFAGAETHTPSTTAPNNAYATVA